MIEDRVTIELRCTRCGARNRSVIDVVICEHGTVAIHEGTLDGAWAMRWARSHQAPEAWLVVC